MTAGTPPPGTIAWVDLTVADAEAVRDFYRDVVGWEAEGVDMDGYADFNMVPPGGEAPIAGVCHARGTNADLPAAWLVYLVVEDVGASARRCVERGGEVVVEPRSMAGGRFCVIRDPAGAVAALYEPPRGE